MSAVAIPNLSDFVKSFAHQSERGAALAHAAALDDCLLSYIKTVLVDDKRALGDLFGSRGSLGTYGSRVRLGYLLGLYPIRK